MNEKTPIDVDGLEYLGKFAVDSGSLIIVDPSYICSGEGSLTNRQQIIAYKTESWVRPESGISKGTTIPFRKPRSNDEWDEALAFFSGNFGGDGVYSVYGVRDPVHPHLHSQLVIDLTGEDPPDAEKAEGSETEDHTQEEEIQPDPTEEP